MTSTSRPRLWIVADDLTGAADASVAFVGSASQVVVLVDPLSDVPEGSPQVVAVNTDVRALPRSEVEGVLQRIFDRIPPGDDLLFKIDSTLRGPVDLMINAVRRARPGHGIMIVPALPRLARITIGGRHLVDGKRLLGSDAWCVETEAPPDLISEVVGPGVHIPLSVVRGQVAEFVAEIERAADAGEPVIVDAVRDTDLDAVVAAVNRARSPQVLVGSAGIAAAVARTKHVERRRSSQSERHSANTGSLLAVIGSATDLARRQAVTVAAELPADFARLAAEMLLAADDDQLEAIALNLAARTNNADVVVTVDGPPIVGRQTEIDRALTIVTAGAVTMASHLLIVGGQTARSVLREAGLSVLVVDEELQLGTVLTHPSARPTMSVILKAGALGDDDILTRAIRSTRAKVST
jgi:uncharacterized protein YgbK (DUF1537 family)